MFRSPEMLLLLAVLPLLGNALSRAQRKTAEAAEKLGGAPPAASGKLNRQKVLRLAAFAALILALARPCWNPRPVPVPFENRDLAVLLDISRSMLAEDLFPSRLEAAKIALVESLPALRGRRIGLITFAGAATVRVPLTLDHHFVRYMLERAAPSDAEVGGTSLQAAIEKAIDTVLSGAEAGNQDLILFTDGEDHISDVEQTAALLGDCGARVLIIGLGDPVSGARIPDPADTNAWMQFKGEEVLTRLDEETLKQLAAASPNVIYHSAAVRPFDLLPLYREMIADTAALPLGAGTEIHWTEGGPLLIALTLLLWGLSSGGQITSGLRRLTRPPARTALLVLLLNGCSPSFKSGEADFALHSEQGAAFWLEAQPLADSDPRAAVALLNSAREEFLRAALLLPGDRGTAEQIAGISNQLRAVLAAIEAQEQAEREQQKQIEEAAALLKELVPRENALARRSQQILTRRPPVPEEERVAAAAESLVEQTSVREGTQEVLEILLPFQQRVQTLLKTLYGEGEQVPPTEFDPAVDLLQAAVSSQQTAIERLAPEQLNWPQANPALRTAAAKMQQALESLTGQGQTRSQDDSDPSEDDGAEWDFDEDAEWDESSQTSDSAMPMSSQSFQTALENRSMPIPNYTAEEILMEEAANQEQRARQKAGRAAQVEKNW